MELELSFVDASERLMPNGVNPKSGFFNYIRGNDEKKWSQNVPHYEQLKYSRVWEGVDLEVSVMENLPKNELVA